MEMRPEDKYSQIFEHLDLAPVMQALSKPKRRGRKEELNYPAMVYSLLIAKMEGIEFVSSIIKRLESSEEFRIQCRFTGSDRIPSESTYSRLNLALQQKGLLEQVLDRLVRAAHAEGFLTGAHIAVDSSAVEAWDCQYGESAAKRRAARKQKQKKESSVQQLEMEPVLPVSETEPTKPTKPVYGRGNCSAEEKERRRKEREAYEASLPPFEKKIENMLPFTYDELFEAMPRSASRCTKKNSKGKLTTWYGYKANIVVDTDSQYVLSGVLSSAHLNDQRMAVLLLKGLPLKFPMLKVKYGLGDKGYDSTPIYELIRSLQAYPIIDIIHHTAPPEGMNLDYGPVCKEGHAYRYDSFDPKYETLRYTRPSECKECPFAESGCQKVFKIRIETDVRKHTYPARGSKGFKELYKKRTAVERVFAYLKGYYGLKRTRHRGVRANVDFQLSILAYNLTKFALDKLNKRLPQAA
ncbi:MAG: transposase [Paenibacillus macerans]|uniref:Transposase DDE domain protein n=10 Tax=Paenibacillus macerans TaxID=44252 RepID=A0A090ZIK3_PAEMA|nr:transposase [Paenibacillus macerans]KFM95922.1 transposase DDE domain protein [Paenibacillus macerans]KFN10055.1 transposase DDE domain protein [Paenibacillus macerans]MCY7562848.1 transposase [Paenibacillus macerans]MDU7478030.1 transposase [Paenibacillus macerans]MEC0141534.1 transposase [Paenibacillus macerans]